MCDTPVSIRDYAYCSQQERRLKEELKASLQARGVAHHVRYDDSLHDRQVCWLKAANVDIIYPMAIARMTKRTVHRYMCRSAATMDTSSECRADWTCSKPRLRMDASFLAFMTMACVHANRAQ
eukprot:TRINITY_DN11721_c0_g3_i2.p1 TRINITY_DN11721_c0_g3~~TRINITY_DN11721_c0_g3_i2.p1  ORF type:complete len:123 (+),score=9.86 TRINITY_DN11721_c0_g3_i2:527-895(+)